MSKSTTTAKQPGARQIAVEILREHDGPMQVKELTEQVQARAQLPGKTPLATIAAIIYHGAKHGKTFEKTGRGLVALLPEPDVNAPVEKLPPASQAQAPEQADDGPAATPNSVVVKRGREVTPNPKPTAKKRSRAKQGAKA